MYRMKYEGLFLFIFNFFKSFKALRFPETRKTQKTLETLKPNGQFADVIMLWHRHQLLSKEECVDALTCKAACS